MQVPAIPSFRRKDHVICAARPRRVLNHHDVKLAPHRLVLAAPCLVLACLPATATAGPGWRIDLSARGVGSVELDSGSAQMREAIVPAVGARIERRVGPIYLGGAFSAGFPAWYGKTEAALSIDHELVLADPRCEVVPGDFIGEQRCHGARWSIDAGVDAGVGLLYFDAPPETAAASDALIYWGPAARGRLQLHVLDVFPRSRAVGLVVGANVAITSARYMSPGSGTGVRLEPELELGVTMRL
jgi:hypothetical protein